MKRVHVLTWDMTRITSGYGMETSCATKSGVSNFTYPSIGQELASLGIHSNFSRIIRVVSSSSDYDYIVFILAVISLWPSTASIDF
jgi:hypothetical protein